MERLEGIPDVSVRRFGSSVRVTAPEGIAADEVDARLARAGVDTRVEHVDADLEDLFVQLMGT